MKKILFILIIVLGVAVAMNMYQKGFNILPFVTNAIPDRALSDKTDKPSSSSEKEKTPKASTKTEQSKEKVSISPSQSSPSSNLIGQNTVLLSSDVQCSQPSQSPLITDLESAETSLGLSEASLVCPSGSYKTCLRTCLSNVMCNDVCPCTNNCYDTCRQFLTCGQWTNEDVLSTITAVASTS